MDLQIRNKRALVTASTSGIGLAIAQALAAEGARVIVNGRTQERVNAALAQVEGQASGVAAYLCSERASATTGSPVRVDGGSLRSAF